MLSVLLGFFSFLVNKNNYSCFLVIEAMGCVLLFLKQLLKLLLCREVRAVPSHIECTLPDFKLRTFAFVPKLRKLVWDLENFRLSHVVGDFPMLPDLEVKSFWVRVLVWGQ